MVFNFVIAPVNIVMMDIVALYEYSYIIITVIICICNILTNEYSYWFLLWSATDISQKYTFNKKYVCIHTKWRRV